MVTTQTFTPEKLTIQTLWQDSLLLHIGANHYIIIALLKLVAAILSWSRF